jgi:hypothetical protein
MVHQNPIRRPDDRTRTFFPILNLGMGEKLVDELNNRAGNSKPSGRPFESRQDLAGMPDILGQTVVLA